MTDFQAGILAGVFGAYAFSFLLALLLAICIPRLSEPEE